MKNNFIKLLGLVLITLLFFNTVYAATFLFPTGGGTGTSTAPTADQILIGGDTANRYDVKTLTAGSGITLATTSGTVTLSTSVSSFSYPFTNTSYGGSTTTIIGFLDGLFSTASSTFNSSLFITNLSEGVLYNGTDGLTQSTATSSLTASGVLTLSNPISVIGSSASALSLVGGTGGQILGWLGGIPTWTATTTFSSPLVYSAGDVSCPTCGTVTSITGGTGLSGGSITTSGTLSLLSYIATSSAETKGQIPYWTSTNGTPAELGGVATSSIANGTNITVTNGATAFVLGDQPTINLSGTVAIANGGTNATAFTTTGNGVYWNGTSLLTAPLTSAVTYPYATTTAISVSDSLAVTPLTSAMVLTDANGTFAEYTGATCTNQFIRSLSVLGASTCATVVAGDVDLADLTATNGTLTFSGAYDGSTARTIGLNLGNANTWTAKQTFTNATSTYLSASTYLGIPSTTPTTNGELAIQTTQASSSLRFHDGAAERALYVEKDFSVILASSTLGYYVNSGTTTLRLANFLRPVTLTRWYCKTNGGTINARFGDGTTASSTMLKCDATGIETTLSANNTYVMREDFMLEASSTSSTFDTVTITATIRND